MGDPDTSQPALAHSGIQFLLRRSIQKRSIYYTTDSQKTSKRSATSDCEFSYLKCLEAHLNTTASGLLA